MKGFLILSVIVCAVVGLASSSSRSAPPSPDVPSTAPSDNLTGQPSVPNPGDERPMKDPFTPYGIGDPSASWTYAELTAEEKAVADVGRDVRTFPAVHDAYGSAGAQLAVKAAAAAAAQQLGVDNLGTIGVVP